EPDEIVARRLDFFRAGFDRNDAHAYSRSARERAADGDRRSSLAAPNAGDAVVLFRVVRVERKRERHVELRKGFDALGREREPIRIHFDTRDPDFPRFAGERGDERTQKWVTAGELKPFEAERACLPDHAAAGLLVERVTDLRAGVGITMHASLVTAP